MKVSENVLGTFRLEKPMSGTGIGMLYRAVDESSGRPAVVKVLNPYFSSEPALVARLFEILDRAHALPPHPSVLPPLAWGEEDGSVWIASDLASAGNIEHLDTPVPDATVLAIVDGIAAGLEHAGTGGLSHGDLKPANVFYDPESGRVQIGDFGMAVLGQCADPLMRSGLKTPHPGYTPPEALNSGVASSAADVFSLGVLTYRLFTGELPFGLDTRSASRNALQPGRPSRLGVWSTGLSQALAMLLDRAFDPRPEQRPSSPGSFARDLRLALEAGPALEPAALPEPGPSLDEEAAKRIYWSSAVTPDRWFTGKRLRAVWRDWVLPALLVFGVLAGYAAWIVYNDLPPVIAPATSNLASSVTPQRWELPRYDLSNSGYVPVSSRSIRGELRWQFKTSDPFRAAPATDGATVFAGTGDNRVVALDAASGALRWETPTTGPVDCTPVIAGDFVYVGLRDKRILALDRATGKLRWEYKTGNPVSRPGVVTGGILYQGSTDGLLYALDAATGGLLWTYDAGETISGAPAVLDDVIVVVSDNGWVQIIDRATGRKRFDYLNVGNVASIPVVTNDTAYASIGGFGRRTARLFAVDIRQKLGPWEREIYFARGVLWLWGILDPPPPPRGARWSASLPGFYSTSPALASGKLFIGSAKKVLAINQASGAQEWAFDSTSTVSGSPIASNDAVYAGTEDGTLYALDPASGKELWSFKAGGILQTNAVLAAGELFVASSNGTLYALQ